MAVALRVQDRSKVLYNPFEMCWNFVISLYLSKELVKFAVQ